MTIESQHWSVDGVDASIVADPRWFPRDMDPQTGTISFVRVERETLASQNFLDVHWDTTALPHKRISAPAVWKALDARAPPPRVNFIWHTGFCCSTAIAKALDYPGRNLSLCEPQLLVSVADVRRFVVKNRRDDLSWLSELAFRLLGRPFIPGACVTVKPAPAANFLLADAAAKTSGKMLFLHSDCRSFLLASMRRGENRRRYVRSLFTLIQNDGNAPAQWSQDRIAGLTDLEIASLTWQLQMAQFLRYLPQFGDRAASLDCEAFLADPREVFARIWKFLELPGDAQERANLLDPAFIAQHAKYPGESFSLEERRTLETQLDSQARDELERVVESSAALFPAVAGALPLPNALASAGKGHNRI